ncbi:MAG: hypothetical protein ACTHQM_15305 [Thermoanaerobaculia bacterium]
MPDLGERFENDAACFAGVDLDDTHAASDVKFVTIKLCKCGIHAITNGRQARFDCDHLFFDAHEPEATSA